MTAYNRGQVLYRIAEMIEARRAEFADALLRAEGGRALDRPRRLVRGLGRQARAGARLVEPGRRPVLQLHRPGADRRRRRSSRPTSRALAGLVSRLAPAIVGGNAVVVVASETHPLAAIELAEVLATSDVPGGVVNILTGLREELAPVARRRTWT